MFKVHADLRTGDDAPAPKVWKLSNRAQSQVRRSEDQDSGRPLRGPSRRARRPG